MNLFTVHKVMIAAAIGVSLLFAAWASWMAGARGSASHVWLALLALLVAAGLGGYLRYFARLRLPSTRERPRRGPGPPRS